MRLPLERNQIGIGPANLAETGDRLLTQFVKEKIMSESEWGLCKDCKWWQIEPGAKAANNVMGLCIDEELLEFRLRVSGNSGCNRFMAGSPAHAKGSSAAPPVAQPTR